MNASNQPQQKQEQKVQKKQEQGSKAKKNYIQGRLNNVDMTTAHRAKEVVYGIILVNSASTTVLFDPRASHSFISSAYVKEHKITILPMRRPVIVKSPGGEMKADHICPRVSLNIKGVKFEANLIVLELVDIDVILRIGWLSACKGVIKYAQRSVLLTAPSGERIEYEGIQPVPEDNVDKKRKEISPETESKSHQHLGSITLSHPTPIPGRINSDSKELEVSQAKVTPVFPPEVCIDGWTITYTEFQPQKIKRAKKRSNQTKMNLQSQQADNTLSNNSMECDITKDPAKRKCYYCQQEGHYVKSCPQKDLQICHGGSQS
jgi:hypothetical protein